jgi:hypothetical protein
MVEAHTKATASARTSRVATCNLRRVNLRICFVTPFGVVAAARGQRTHRHPQKRSGSRHEAPFAPSSRARDLLADGALQRGDDLDVIAVGPSVPLSRRTNIGVPVAVRANLRLALTTGRFDVVHGFEPGLPSLSYLALTTTQALTAATFFSVDRLGYPARRSRRDRLRTRVDALLATSPETAEAASERFEGEYRVVPLGIDLETFAARDEARPHCGRARGRRPSYDPGLCCAC